MPGARCTRSPCAKGSKHTVVTTVAPEITRHSRAQWFYGLYVIFSVTGLLSPSSA
jgi:hypothetical protein